MKWYFKDKVYRIALFAVTIFGFLLRLITAKSDPFLHSWDERFHALVARNMMHSPFKPMLRAFPVTDNFDINEWCCNHIWLHKQPLFMWQMALSMKAFGVNELALRLPSVLMGTMMILLLFRIGQIFTKNNWVSLSAAAFLAFSTFHIRMSAGIWGMDHNDVAHGFYVLAAIWAYCEYTTGRKWYWIVLIGVFSGAAILVKWLTGLLVFLAWGVNILINLRKPGTGRVISDLVKSLLICCLVFLPWQIYILNQWPVQANYEYEFNRRHITEVLEGHGGDMFYYLNFLFREFWHLIIFLPVGFVTVFKDKLRDRNLYWPLLVSACFVFLFFSIIVRTKVETHIFFIMPLYLIFIAGGIHSVNKIFKSEYLKLVIPLVFIIISIKYDYWKYYYSDQNSWRNDRIYNTEIYKNIKNYIPEDVKLVMNVNGFEDVEIMFYHNDLTAYHFTLQEKDFKELQKRKVKVAVFRKHGKYELPEYVKSYPYLYVINKTLRSI